MLLPNNNKDEDANTDVNDHDNNSATTRQPQSEDCVSKMPSLLTFQYVVHEVMTVH